MSFAIAAALRLTIVLACAGIMSLVLKRSSAAIRCAVWTIALLCGLILPLSDVLMPAPVRVNLPVLPAKKSESVIVRSLVPETISPVQSPAAPDTSRATASLPQFQWFTITWAFGFVFLLGRLLRSTISAMRLVRKAPSLPGPSWSPLLRELKKELHISQTIELRCGETVPPFTWGFFRHSILLPSDAEAWPPDMRRAVLAHELAHAKRFDGLTHFLIQIVCSVYWFNPLVWMAARRMRLERERACDDYAINSGAKADVYADHLMDLASRSSGNFRLATVSIAHRSQLEIRLRAILNSKTRRGKLSRWAAAFMVVSLTAVLFSVTAIHLTTLLTLSLPTSFRAMAAPLMPEPEAKTEQQPQQPAPVVTGSVTGRVVWSDGAPAGGTTISAIATSTEGLPAEWVMGIKLAGSAITDSNGQYRIENLPAGLYHIVTGPVYLPRTFSDVSLSSSDHLATVVAGRNSGGLNFATVRSTDTVSDSNLTITITGKLVMMSFGGPRGPAVQVNNPDGNVVYWQFRGSAGSAMYWWPGLDAGKGGVLEKMAGDGETVTISGKQYAYNGRPNLRILIASEVTRRGIPAR